ncbi:hypothetical protein PG995_015781 [Apiospora arundinis]
MQLKENDRIDVEESIGSQRELHDRARRSRQFNADEKSALKLDSVDAAGAYFQQIFGDSLTAKNEFDRKRSHGVGRATQKATIAAASVHDMLNALSPIIDVIKDTGIPYAGIAIGTITFVFAVAKNRQEREKKINAMLIAIQDRLLGLQLYRQIYQEHHALDRQIQAKIVVAYNSFIRFCAAVVDYYDLGGLHRLSNSLRRSTSLDEKAATVQESIMAVRRIGEELQHKTSNLIRAELETVKILNEELRTIQDEQELKEIRQILGTEYFVLPKELLQLEGRLQRVKAEFRQYSSPGKNNVEKRLAEVENDEAYISWQNSPQSQVLVLVGQNRIQHGPHCWLSPIANRWISTLSQRSESNKEPFAFYMLAVDGDDTFGNTLSIIVYRLLSQHWSILRDKTARNAIQAAARKYKELAPGELTVEHTRLLRTMLFATLSMFKSGTTVWIILDRLDQCICATSKRNVHRNAVLKTLLSLVTDTELEVKLRVLIVANCLDWNVEEDTKDDFEESQRDFIVIRTIPQIKPF